MSNRVHILASLFSETVITMTMILSPQGTENSKTWQNHYDFIHITVRMTKAHKLVRFSLRKHWWVDWKRTTNTECVKIPFVATLHRQVSEVSTWQLTTESLLLSVPYVTGACQSPIWRARLQRSHALLLSNHSDCSVSREHLTLHLPNNNLLLTSCGTPVKWRRHFSSHLKTWQQM